MTPTIGIMQITSQFGSLGNAKYQKKIHLEQSMIQFRKNEWPNSGGGGG
jgi:hypothetical protein